MTEVRLSYFCYCVPPADLIPDNGDKHLYFKHVNDAAHTQTNVNGNAPYLTETKGGGNFELSAVQCAT